MHLTLPRSLMPRARLVLTTRCHSETPSSARSAWSEERDLGALQQKEFLAMIPGVSISMGGNDWTVPPLTLGQLRRLDEKIRAMTEIGHDARGMTREQIDTIAEIVAAAMQRNYPDMTADRVLELIDVGNAKTVILAVLTGSGLQPGEAAAVVKGNGIISTASSPPLAGTPIQ